MLRFAEEIILLLLDDESGNFAHIPSWSMDYALAGGVLMDLALENRIDTDLERLVVMDGTPTGDTLLDPALADIVADAAAGGERDARYWVERQAERAEATREECLKRLVAAGILEERQNRTLWVFKSQQYPTRDDTQERAVRRRIMDVLLSDDIPEPRDVVTIGLADATGDLQEHAVRPGAGAGVGAHRAGAEAGPDRAGDDAGDPGHRGVDRDGGAAAFVLGETVDSESERASPREARFALGVRVRCGARFRGSMESVVAARPGENTARHTPEHEEAGR